MGDPTWSEEDERAAGELLARLLGPRNESPTMICLHNTAMACIREWATAERARVAGEAGELLTLLENDLGGWFLSAPATDPLGMVRDRLRAMRRGHHPGDKDGGR